MAPLPHLAHAVLTQAVYDVTRDLIETLFHELIGFHQGLAIGVFHELSIPAPVILEIVKPPERELHRILHLMLITPFIPLAGGRAGGNVDTGLEPQGMDILYQAGHVRKLPVAHQHALVVPRRPIDQRIL